MHNLEICGKVEKAHVGVVDLNGFTYYVTEVTIGNIQGIKAFLPAFITINDGDCFKSSSYALTKYVPKDGSPETLAVRVDSLDVVPEFEKADYFVCKVIGMVMSSERCKIQYVGPTNKPFYRCTLRIKDENGNNYSVLLVAFKEAALKLANTPRQTIIAAEINVRRQKYVDEWEFCVNNFEVMDNKKNKEEEE